jgi:hypothetical protein
VPLRMGKGVGWGQEWKWGDAGGDSVAGGVGRWRAREAVDTGGGRRLPGGPLWAARLRSELGLHKIFMPREEGGQLNLSWAERRKWASCKA